MSDIITGARAALYLGSVKIAVCEGVTVSQEIQTEPHEPLDTVEPAEHVIVGMRASMTAQVTRVLNKPATQLGLFFNAAQAKNGGPELTAKVRDSVSGTVLYTVIGVKPTNRNTSFQARAKVMTDLSFVARSVQDEYTDPANVGL